MTIKARLALAVVALLAVATAVLATVAVTSARDSMVDQIDDRLQEIARRPPMPIPPVGGTPRGAPGNLPDNTDEQGTYRDTAELLVASDGDTVFDLPAGFPGDPEPLPEIPSRDSPDWADLIDGTVTLPATDGSLEYRATATPIENGLIRVVAGSLADVEDATSRLLLIVLITAAAVLAAGGVASWLVIRRGLRPVDRMIDTAGEIAAGDLSRRVEHADEETELGRLARAVNEMLGRLEEAFDAREASQARLKRFVADASHELRTPVAAIRGYAELYRKGGLPQGDSLDRAMGRIEAESERVGKLVEDLLLLARLDQQQPLEHGEVDMVRIARDAVEDMGAIDPDRPVAVEADGPALVNGDDAKLRQAVGNLLANARAHTPAGSPVEVRVAECDGEVAVSVADHGPGIGAADVERVFERFYRTDPSRSREAGGTGLGLAIVAAVAEAHGGRVELDSEPGKGATFTLLVPGKSQGSPRFA